MTVINKTPHPVYVVDGEGKVIRTYEKDATPIRLASKTVSAGALPDGTPLTATEFGEPEGLPAYQEGTWYIVSQIVKSALPDRTDLLVPAEVVRDSAGQIVGCKSLGR
jgi:hypothetical protein